MVFDDCPFRLRYKATRLRQAAADRPAARVLVNAEDFPEVGFPATLDDLVENAAVYANGSVLYAGRECSIAANLNKYLCPRQYNDWNNEYSRTFRPTRNKWQGNGFAVENALIDSAGAGGAGIREVFAGLNMMPFTKTGSAVATAVDESLRGSLIVPPRSTIIIRLDFIPPSETTCVLSRRNIGSQQMFDGNAQVAHYEDDIRLEYIDLTLYARHRTVEAKPMRSLKMKYQTILFNYFSIPDNIAKVTHYVVLPAKTQRLFIFFLRDHQITPRSQRSAEKKFLRPSRLQSLNVIDASALETPLLSLKNLEVPSSPHATVMGYLTNVRELLQDPSYKLADFVPRQPTDESFGFIGLCELTSCRKKPEMVRIELAFLQQSNVSNLYLCVGLEEERKLRYSSSENVYTA